MQVKYSDWMIPACSIPIPILIPLTVAFKFSCMVYMKKQPPQAHWHCLFWMAKCNPVHYNEATCCWFTSGYYCSCIFSLPFKLLKLFHCGLLGKDSDTSRVALKWMLCYGFELFPRDFITCRSRFIVITSVLIKVSIIYFGIPLLLGKWITSLQQKRVYTSRFFLSNMRTPDWSRQPMVFALKRWVLSLLCHGLWCTHVGQEEPKLVYTLFGCKPVEYGG